MTDSILYVHVGYPKTGTTTLQKSVFPKISEISFLSGCYDQNKKSTAPKLSALYLWQAGAAERAELVSYMRHELKGAVFALLSAESLLAQSMVPVPGRSECPLVRDVMENLSSIAADAGFSSVRCIVTIRRQSELWSSFFAEAYMDRFSKVSGLDTFDGLVDHLCAGGSIVSADVADFYALDSVLTSVFGEGNTLFLPLEWMKRNPEEYSAALEQFMELNPGSVSVHLSQALPENVRRDSGSRETLKVRRKNARYFLDRLKRAVLPGRSIGLGRIIGPWLGRLEYGPSHITPSRKSLARLEDYYRLGNERFVARYPQFAFLVQDEEQHL